LLFKIISTVLIVNLYFSLGLSAYTWDGEPWADYTNFMSPITNEVKENCLSIMVIGKIMGRVQGRLGFIGDSITFSMAYMANSLGAGAENNETGHNYDSIRSWLCEGNPGWNCWYTKHNWLKGPAHGNYSGWRISNALRNGHPEKSVKNGNYSWCMIMFGTNDIDGGWDPDTWKINFKKLVQEFIDLGVIPVLSTVPPERAHVKDRRVERANEKIVELAKEMEIPIVDYYAVIKHYKPGNSWNGTLIARDGTHPSGNGTDFSKNGITNTNGNATLSKLTYDMAEKIKEIVFNDGPPEMDRIKITTHHLPEGYINHDYRPFQLNAAWGQKPYKWKAVNLPVGMTLRENTAVISGSPSEHGIFKVKIKVAGRKNYDTRVLDLIIKTGMPPVTIALDAIQDTYLSGGRDKDKNFGNRKMMECQGNNTDKYQKVSLIKFDLDKITVDAKINSATLRLFCRREQNNKGGILKVFGVNQDWTEKGATFIKSNGTRGWLGGNINEKVLDEEPAFIAENHAKLDGSRKPNPEYKPGPNPYGHEWNRAWVKCDIKPLIEQWLHKSRPNNGLAVCTTGYVRNVSGKINDPKYGYMSLIFTTRESKNPPELIVEYQPQSKTRSNK